MFCAKSGLCVPNTDPDELIIRTEQEFEDFKTVLKELNSVFYRFFFEPNAQKPYDRTYSSVGDDEEKEIKALLDKYEPSVRAADSNDSVETCSKRIELAHRVLALRSVLSKNDKDYWDCDVWNCLAKCGSPQGKFNLAMRYMQAHCIDPNLDVDVHSVIDQYIMDAAKAGIKDARCIENLDTDCPSKKPQNYFDNFNSGSHFSTYPEYSGKLSRIKSYFTVHQSSDGEYYTQFHLNPNDPDRPRQKTSLRTKILNIDGNYDKRFVHKVFRSHYSNLKNCIDNQVNSVNFPTVYSGYLNLKFAVAPQGNVTRVVKGDSTLENYNIETCLLNAVHTFRFFPTKAKKLVLVDVQISVKH